MRVADNRGSGKQVLIANSDGPLSGDELLQAVTDAMVALHERYYHRKPGAAKTRLIDDELLVCVMGGVYTDVEKTLIEVQHSRQVRESRSAFQRAMEHEFISAAERLTGRAVVAFFPTHHIGPDLEIQLFVLDTPTDSA